MGDLPSFDDRDGSIWFDGKLVPWREANVHILTHALHYASSVFEGQRAYGGRIAIVGDPKGHSTSSLLKALMIGD